MNKILSYVIGIVMLLASVAGALAVSDNDEYNNGNECNQIKHYIKTHEDEWSSDASTSGGSGMSWKKLWFSMTGTEASFGKDRLTIQEYLRGEYVTRAEFEELKEDFQEFKAQFY